MRAMKLTRHLARAITWRMVATSTTFLVAFLLTGEFHLSLSIGLLEGGAKILLYVIHDYMWELPQHTAE